MREKICFLFGHRVVPTGLAEDLRQQVRLHIQLYGVNTFVVGHYGQFDAMAAQVTAELKREYPQIQLYLLLPYHPAERGVALPKGFDGSIYPPGLERVPRQLAIVRANRYMTARASYLIAYVDHGASNGAALLTYAQSRAARGLLHITNLG